MAALLQHPGEGVAHPGEPLARERLGGLEHPTGGGELKGLGVLAGSSSLARARALRQSALCSVRSSSSLELGDHLIEPLCELAGFVDDFDPHGGVDLDASSALVASASRSILASRSAFCSLSCSTASSVGGGARGGEAELSGAVVWATTAGGSAVAPHARSRPARSRLQLVQLPE